MRVRPYAAVLCLLSLAACNETQSALAPHGSSARDIAALTWLLFGMAGLVTLIVVIATALAVAGSDRMRLRLSRVQTVVIGGLIFPAVVLTGLLAYGVWLMRVHAAPSQKPAEIEIIGEQWWWRVRYLSADGGAFESANEIRLPVGREVTLALKSADVIHSFWIPSLAGKMDMIPGRTNSLRLKAERSGIYRGACAEFCGGPHAWMALHAVVIPQEEFDRWLQARRTGSGATFARSPGQVLFESAGCGGCHAIDGSGAGGIIGPNLTGLGSRPSIGAGLLPTTPDNIARFVVHGQRLKPGNKMPPFPIFSDVELAALAAYLAALK